MARWLGAWALGFYCLGLNLLLSTVLCHIGLLTLSMPPHLAHLKNGDISTYLIGLSQKMNLESP